MAFPATVYRVMIASPGDVAAERAVVRDRAARLRAAGDAALVRHLEARVGQVMDGLVEKPGIARAADFTEIAFEGTAEVGAIVAMRIAGQDGRRARAVVA